MRVKQKLRARDKMSSGNCFCLISDKNSGDVYIMMEARISALFKSEEKYEILEKYVL